MWERYDRRWYGVNGERIIRISVVNGKYEITYFPDLSSYEDDYFRSDDNIAEIFSEISREPFVAELLKAYPGLRLLRQHPFQCLISFICATNSTIPAIRASLIRLCRTLGKEVMIDGNKFYTFPDPAALANSTIKQLRSCSVGYRAPAIKETSCSVFDGSIDLQSLRRVGYEQARERLLTLSGVGHKVADCVMLFSLDKLDAFPVDVWIHRALAANYRALVRNLPNKLSPRQYEIVSSSVRNYFGRYAGYAQQFLYYYIRNQAGRTW